MSWGHARDYFALVINPTRRPRANGTFIGFKSGVPLRLCYQPMFYTLPNEGSIASGVSTVVKQLSNLE